MPPRLLRRARTPEGAYELAHRRVRIGGHFDEVEAKLIGLLSRFAGEHDAEVLAFVQARYGDFVLLKPPFKPETYALWLAPVVLLLIGAATTFAVLRAGPRRAGERPLTDAEDRAVAAILGSENGDKS